MNFSMKRTEADPTQVLETEDSPAEEGYIRESFRPRGASKPAREVHDVEPEENQRLCILLFPDSHNAKEFWTLYQKILRSGLRCHAGIFEEIEGKWSERDVL